MNGTVGAGKDDKGIELTIYWEFMYSFKQYIWGKGAGWNQSKESKKVKAPSTYPLLTVFRYSYLHM
jgi:hypothetical protein